MKTIKRIIGYIVFASGFMPFVMEILFFEGIDAWIERGLPMQIAMIAFGLALILSGSKNNNDDAEEITTETVETVSQEHRKQKEKVSKKPPINLWNDFFPLYATCAFIAYSYALFESLGESMRWFSEQQTFFGKLLSALLFIPVTGIGALFPALIMTLELLLLCIVPYTIGYVIYRFFKHRKA